MPPRESQDTLLESVLDRLIDREPNNRYEAGVARAQSFRQIKASLRRDLEGLLNTRQSIDTPPDWAREMEDSLFTYGLPDFTNHALHTPQDQDRLVRTLETAIERFEPRLQNVVVSMQPVTPTTRVLRFHIEGLLRTDAAPERVAFDTVLELSSGQYQVGDNGAR